MITCMSSMTRDSGRRSSPRLAFVIAGFAVALTGCGNTSVAEPQSDAKPDPALVQAAAVEPTSPPNTGTPAQPAPNSGDISPVSQVISKEEMPLKFPDRGGKPGCFITFAYAGHPPETLIWDGEPCTAVTTLFLSPAELKKNNDWDRLALSDQGKVMALPDQRVLYVGGEFTASVYPLDYNNLTYEIVVSD